MKMTFDGVCRACDKPPTGRGRLRSKGRGVNVPPASCGNLPQGGTSWQTVLMTGIPIRFLLSKRIFLPNEANPSRLAWRVNSRHDVLG